MVLNFPVPSAATTTSLSAARTATAATAQKMAAEMRAQNTPDFGREGLLLFINAAFIRKKIASASRRFQGERQSRDRWDYFRSCSNNTFASASAGSSRSAVWHSLTAS